MKVTLLTGGSDRPYAFGIVKTLVSKGVTVDFIGSDELVSSELSDDQKINFLNLRGNTAHESPRVQKVVRIYKYYVRLLLYSVKTDTKVFHILWANRFLVLDRLLLNIYYKLLGKKLILTAHNVNQEQRDGHDDWFNRLTLRGFYALMDHIFVHTEKMKLQLLDEFNVIEKKVSVIPFGINNTLPKSKLTRSEAKLKLGMGEDEKVFLFFGRVANYKGLEFAIEALDRLVKGDDKFRLVVAGRIEQGHETHWEKIEAAIEARKLEKYVIRKIEYIPDEDVEIYFKSADALILPYKQIFQSGVLFLAYSFGLPVIATDVGSFRDDIIEGETGMICRPGDADDLADTLNRYFDSELFRNFETTAVNIIDYGNRKYSWEEVGNITCKVYEKLLSS
ncbi:MAG: glycosyltransferase family 4 protein [Thiotrichaceae bacterium]